MASQNDSPDLRTFLDGWPYDPLRRVRLSYGADGREIILVRQPMGVEEYETQGRPDGKRPYGMDSVLDFHLHQLSAALDAKRSAFVVTGADCAELFDEALLYQQRCLLFFELKDLVRAERDAARNLHLLTFVQSHAERDEDRVQFATWRPSLWQMHAVIRAMLFLAGNDASPSALHDEPMLPGSRWLMNESGFRNERCQAQPRSRCFPAVNRRNESLFVQEGDYWTIAYEGQLARLKHTRGLNSLARLLRHPGQEFHVTELLADPPGPAGSSEVEPSGHEAEGIGVTTIRALSSQPLLDARAKGEFRQRVRDLQDDLAEAQRFNDSARACQVRAEMDAITEQLAVAVGLGGRDRKTSSAAERARSSVTKRIKESIARIDAVLPALGRHLAARIKTGYFCSYNPHPDRHVAWKF